MQNWSNMLTFPVIFEGAEDKMGKWHIIYEAETQEEFDFKIHSYKFPVYPFMRVRDATGETFEVSQSRLMHFNATAAAKTNEKGRPLEGVSPVCTYTGVGDRARTARSRTRSAALPYPTPLQTRSRTPRFVRDPAT